MTDQPGDLHARLRAFLDEDVGTGDVTSEALVEVDRRAVATLEARAAGVISGLDLAGQLFALLDPAVEFEAHVGEGTAVISGQRLATVRGRARAILTAERSALNLLQRMSGIASLTARFVAAVTGTGAAIMETRKTAPGLRWFDKQAVAAGGGRLHRRGLFDQILVKENHLAVLGVGTGAAGVRPIEEAVRRAREAAPDLLVEIEVRDREEALRAVAAGADVVMLDNFTVQQVAEAVAAIRARSDGRGVEVEASGGITLESVRAFAEAGVERISVGALTHSPPALDVTLLFELA